MEGWKELDLSEGPWLTQLVQQDRVLSIFPVFTGLIYGKTYVKPWLLLLLQKQKRSLLRQWRMIIPGWAPKPLKPHQAVIATGQVEEPKSSRAPCCFMWPSRLGSATAFPQKSWEGARLTNQYQISRKWFQHVPNHQNKETETISRFEKYPQHASACLSSVTINSNGLSSQSPYVMAIWEGSSRYVTPKGRHRLRDESIMLGERFITYTRTYK